MLWLDRKQQNYVKQLFFNKKINQSINQTNKKQKTITTPRLFSWKQKVEPSEEKNF